MIDPDSFGPLEQVRVVLVAVAIAGVTAFIRVMADESETRFLRILIEAIFCGLITFSVCFALIALELHWGWSIFAGGVIGSVGSNYLRVLARKAMSKKACG